MARNAADPNAMTAVIPGSIAIDAPATEIAVIAMIGRPRDSRPSAAGRSPDALASRMSREHENNVALMAEPVAKRAPTIAAQRPGSPSAARPTDANATSLCATITESETSIWAPKVTAM